MTFQQDSQHGCVGQREHRDASECPIQRPRHVRPYGQGSREGSAAFGNARGGAWTEDDGEGALPRGAVRIMIGDAGQGDRGQDRQEQWNADQPRQCSAG